MCKTHKIQYWPDFLAVVYTRFIDEPGLNYAITVLFLNYGFLKSGLIVNLVQTVVYI